MNWLGIPMNLLIVFGTMYLVIELFARRGERKLLIEKITEIRPEDFGFTRGKKSDIVGGTPEQNARVARDILANKKGPKYDVVMLNAGAAIYIGGKADSLAEGITRAKELVASGAAKKKLEEFIAISNQ